MDYNKVVHSNSTKAPVSCTRFLFPITITNLKMYIFYQIKLNLTTYSKVVNIFTFFSAVLFKMLSNSEKKFYSHEYIEKQKGEHSMETKMMHYDGSGLFIIRNK